MIKPFEKPIYVTRPFLPPLEEFCEGLKEIWDNHWITNDGPILQRFCRQLSNYFETDIEFKETKVIKKIKKNKRHLVENIIKKTS